MPDQKRESWTPSADQWAAGTLDGVKKGTDIAAKSMLASAPVATRYVLKRIPGVPGLVLNIVELGASPNKWRTASEIAGSTVGAGVGGLAGPVGAVVGSAVGAKAGELLYDHQDDIKAWMRERQRALEQREADMLRPYLPPAARGMI